MNASTFRIADLLAEPNLGLQLLTDGDPDTPIAGAHAIEIANPSRWLKPGWLMLTTGTRFTGPATTADQQRALIRELHSAGMGALAFGVGISLETVPEALVDEAERHRFPLLAVPWETPFLEVIDAVNQATLTRDVYLLKRTVSIQDSLLESLAAQDPAGSLVHRLAELLRGTVVLYGPSGTILASSGTGPTKIIRAEIAQQPEQRRHFAVGRWHVLTDPVRTETMLHWLAVASRRRSVSRALAEPAMEAARRVVTMIVRSHASIQEEDRTHRAELLRSIMTGDGSDNAHLWDRLEMYRFRRDGAVRALLLTDSSPPAQETRQVAAVAGLSGTAPYERAASEAGLLLLLVDHGDRCAGLAAADEAALQRWLAALPQTARCGMSAPSGDLTRGRTRMREAEAALHAAARDHRTGLQFEHLGLVDWLIAGHDASSVEAKAEEALAPISDNPSLRRALVEYFRCGGQIQRTAHQLGLHPNSVRYRLKRASALLGYDLSTPSDLAEMALSLRLLGTSDHCGQLPDSSASSDS